MKTLPDCSGGFNVSQWRGAKMKTLPDCSEGFNYLASVLNLVARVVQFPLKPTQGNKRIVSKCVGRIVVTTAFKSRLYTPSLVFESDGCMF